MQRIDSYIRNNVLVATALVLFVLGSLDLIFSIFDEIGETDDQYQTMAALGYSLLTFPSHLYKLLPMTALIGALIGLGILASSNELVVMQAAGVKINRIVWAVMKPAGLVMLLGLVLGEYLAPGLELRGEVNKAIASGDQVALSSYGHWEKDSNAYMHFNAIEPRGVLHGVTIFEFDAEQQMTRNTYAEKAIYQGDTSGGWLLENGSVTEFDQSGEEILSQNTAFESLPWDVDFTPELLEVLIIDDPDKMAISDLYKYARRAELQGQDASPYFLSFWKKLLQPLTTAALVLVAISFIFGPLRQATMGSRLFTAICFGLAFTILQRLLNTVSLLYQFQPLVAVLLPILLCAMLGLVLLRKNT